MEVTSPVNISKNININQPASQGNTNQNTNVQADRRINNKVYSKFINANAAVPLDVHVTSNLATLRVFADDRNLYEIMLGKEAKHKSRGMHWYAAAGTTIGTIVPALIFYGMKFKKGKVNLDIINSLQESINGNDFKSLELSEKIKNIAEKASSKTKRKLLDIAEELKDSNNDEAFNKLLKVVGLNKKENLLEAVGAHNSIITDLKGYFNKYHEECKELYKGTGITDYLKYLTKTDEFSLSEVLIIGTGSVLGGLLGGIAKDKGEVNKKKVKEANFQLITNIICPTILTAVLVNKFGLSTKEFKNKVRFIDTFKRENLLPSLKKAGKGAAAILLGVGTGITVGSHIANWMNKQYFKNEKYERRLHHFDVLIHVDDVPIALNFMKVPFMDKLLLFCSGLCGYKAGEKE